jgi:hypothetical protein
MDKFKTIFILFIFNTLFISCAFDLVHVKQLPTKLDTTQQPKSSFILEKEEKIDLGTGYSRVIKAGTKWDYVGTIENGDVYNTKDQVLTVEASNIHEAYIVISSGKLVGFYLPVEKTFSPLSEFKELIMKEAPINQ